MEKELYLHEMSYKKQIINLRIMFPLIYLIIGLAVAPLEHSFTQSLEYIQEKPISAIFSIVLFSFAIPRIGFITDSSPLTPLQQKLVWGMTLMAFVLAIYIVK